MIFLFMKPCYGILPKTLTLPRPHLKGVPVQGFWFDALVNDYKIVRIVKQRVKQRQRWTTLGSQIKIFSLNDNSWRMLESEIEAGWTVRKYTTPAMHGCLHWRAHDENKYGVILCIDMHTEIFREIQLPENLKKNPKYWRLIPYKETSLALFGCIGRLMVKFIALDAFY
ncbi:F-box protein CPR1-like [Rutidosis leptorrhynchoides]|uniref:F-box protein CPR1-like n=1 Tax=Rutidosis leptorrhynchoides TaxID=125765 RepID=UPI003A99EA3D